ncbi:MAG: hypothetical protein FJY67_03290, partial [Calditrichaeota bacterium]|nr:hypothetical protein [Calditrichota bacterium]
MASNLPINIDDLIRQRTVEQQRVEYKAVWNEWTGISVIRSICAFANDLHNLNGGYIIIGIEEEDGLPKLPPVGIPTNDIDRIQRAIRQGCIQISPNYFPIISPESFMGKHILAIWAPAGDNRPYEAPDKDQRGKVYYIRLASETIVAKGDIRRQLLESAAKIPFDARRSLTANMDDVSGHLLKEFLDDIGSHLTEGDYADDVLFEKLRLSVKINSHMVPRNAGVLFFAREPQAHFPTAIIEVVQFGDDAGGDLIEERRFAGTLKEQLLACISYLESIGGGVTIRKRSDRPESDRTVAYPFEAIREAVVNAVYHRGYDSNYDPIKVYLYPNRMQITSYPGPVSGLELSHLKSGDFPAPPARNRLIGEILKDLRLAEMRGTGLPKISRRMLENGSPSPIFDFDESRFYFRIILPVHPTFGAILASREAAKFWALGDRDNAMRVLRQALETNPGVGTIAAQLVEFALSMQEWETVKEVWNNFLEAGRKSDFSIIALAVARALIHQGKVLEARKVLNAIPSDRSLSEMVERAILHRQSGNIEEAHRILSQAYEQRPDDPKIVHEYAQAKTRLARKIRPTSTGSIETKKRITREAVELLHRAIALADSPGRLAYCWFDLAKSLGWLREPAAEIE